MVRHRYLTNIYQLLNLLSLDLFKAWESNHIRASTMGSITPLYLLQNARLGFRFFFFFTSKKNICSVYECNIYINQFTEFIFIGNSANKILPVDQANFVPKNI